MAPILPPSLASTNRQCSHSTHWPPLTDTPICIFVFNQHLPANFTLIRAQCLSNSFPEQTPRSLIPSSCLATYDLVYMGPNRHAIYIMQAWTSIYGMMDTSQLRPTHSYIRATPDRHNPRRCDERRLSHVSATPRPPPFAPTHAFPHIQGEIHGRPFSIPRLENYS